MTSTPTLSKIDQLLKAVADAIIESVTLAGSMGAPGGSLYAALMSFGFTYDQFEQIMSGLVRAGKLEKRGQLYFVVTRAIKSTDGYKTNHVWPDLSRDTRAVEMAKAELGQDCMLTAEGRARAQQIKETL